MNNGLFLSDFSTSLVLDEQHPILWVGVASFEERCVASLQMLAKQTIRVSHGVVLDYPARIEPERWGELRRSQSRAVILDYIGRNSQLRGISSERFGAFLGILADIHAAHRQVDSDIQYVFDITCLTKIHTLALAYWLATTPDLPRVHIVYSLPHEYGSPVRKVWDKGAWIEVVVAPFDIDPDQRAIGVAGIALLGHEGDRLRLALHEVPLDEGIVVVAESGSPRLEFVADVQNQWLLDDIDRKRHPPTVSLAHVRLWDMAHLHTLVDQIASSAQRKGMRLVLYPFGPKPLVFGASLFAVSNYLLGSWYVYPVPRTYDLDYSVGIGASYWAAMPKA